MEVLPKEGKMKAKLSAAILFLAVVSFAFSVFAAEKTDLNSILASSGDAKKAGACCKKSSSYSFHFSGFFKGDVIYDQTRVNSGNYAVMVLRGEDNDVMNITARETRLGLDFMWKDPECNIKTDAKLEFDFYGLGASPASLNSMENKAAPMLRHAYLRVTKGNWSILAGQTSDVISPLVPKTVNYTVAWGQGNIGYRRPQLRVSTFLNASDAFTVKAAVAAARTLGGDLDGDGTDDGADAGIPTVEGRLAFCNKFSNGGKLEIGFSGHYGTEEYTKADSVFSEGDTTVTSSEQSIKSWSFNVDFYLKANDKVCLSGEYFMGQDLKAYFGGALQSVNPLGNEISSSGGWAMLSVKPCKRLTINSGYAWDDPDEEDFEIPEAAGPGHSFVDLNSCVFGNLMYSITSNVTAMIEVSSLKTTYMDISYNEDTGKIDSSSNEYDDLRIQFALKAAIK